MSLGNSSIATLNITTPPFEECCVLMSEFSGETVKIDVTNGSLTWSGEFDLIDLKPPAMKLDDYCSRIEYAFVHGTMPSDDSEQEYSLKFMAVEDDSIDLMCVLKMTSGVHYDTKFSLAPTKSITKILVSAASIIQWLKNETETLTEKVESLTSKLDVETRRRMRIAEENASMEANLMGKFVALLNTKKQYIRETLARRPDTVEEVGDGDASQDASDDDASQMSDERVDDESMTGESRGVPVGSKDAFLDDILFGDGRSGE